MKDPLLRNTLLFFVLLFCGILSAFAEAKPVELVRVYDGDTITVNIPDWPPIVGHEIGVRIRGIDTPEIRGKCEIERQMAITAREIVSNILTNAQFVELHNISRGKYFRLVADVYADGYKVADRLLVRGLAKPYDGGKKVPWCAP